ncbi:hypothetical protein M9Y10_013930 [Tritrichomonas musculus]|uniref:Ubiquitin-activating enzyme E1 C-terminal domain-containing protein n=1 Tax=Tritrichomonas musculus TaxID=1915356 RepID=A0ABR2L037_9EUKA
MSNDVKYDPNRFDRQIFTLGNKAMEKITSSSVLISGLGGVGLEIAKNIILSGVKSITLHDTEKMTINDLSSHFYADKDSIGQNRAFASKSKLSELWDLANIQVLDKELTKDLIKDSKFDCIIITTPRPYSQILSISEFCHENSIAFILVMTRGVFGFIFNDFGDNFIVNDPNLDDPSPFLIESVSYDETTHKCTFIVNSEDDHSLSTGDLVKFNKIKGMPELNEKEFKAYFDTYRSFSIDYTPESPISDDYLISGYAIKVTQPETIHFKKLAESLKDPHFINEDDGFTSLPNQQQVIISFFSLFKSIEDNKASIEDHDKINQDILSNAKKFNDEFKIVKEIDENFIREFVREDAVISPVASVFGGIAGQEVLKSVTGKFLPMNKFFTLAYIEALQPVNDKSFHTTVKNDRYDAYRLIFGDAQFEVMSKLKYFIVGAGAIGCEILKNWSMMGISTDKQQGKIYVTDYDKIEVSNLSRQFLFRDSDKGQYKSESASKSAKIMNPDINIEAYTCQVGLESETVFTPDFYSSLSGICNAVDNRNARLYNDNQAVYYEIPLLESATEGPKGCVQIFIPHLSNSYSSVPFQPSKRIPICTLHDFPTNIAHCTNWAVNAFNDLFNKKPIEINEFITDDKYLDSFPEKSAAMSRLAIVKRLITKPRPTSYEDCITMALSKFSDFFYIRIYKLIKQHPKDSLGKDGKKFWTGSHLFPKIIKYDGSDEYQQSFIRSATKLYAKMYGIEISDEQYQSIPQLAIKIQNEMAANKNAAANKTNGGQSGKVDTVDSIYNEISPYRKAENLMKVQKFEKDDPTNGHIEFIAAAANLRARNYGITTESEMKIKKIAGNIIPALATTTAVVCGFVSLEMYKVHSIAEQKKTIDDYRNLFMNLGLNRYSFYTPSPEETTNIIEKDAEGKEYKVVSYNTWDKWIIEGDLTVSQFINEVKNKYGLNITSMAIGSQNLYNSTFKDFLDRKITNIYQDVIKLPLIPGKMISLSPLLEDDGHNLIDKCPRISLKIPDNIAQSS